MSQGQGGGAPRGNQNAVKNKHWGEALNRALLADDGKKLRQLADKLIDAAMNGDVQALKEIGDRIDGKPSQELQHTCDLIVQISSTDANL